MPKKTPHPHVAWRGGRPRFTPGPALRAAGHAGHDLRHPDGRWFSRGEAVDWSEAFCRTLGEARAATTGRKPARRAPAKAPARPSPPRPAPVARHPGAASLAALFEEWFRSPKFLPPADPAEAARQRAAKSVYAPATIRDFRQKARVLESHDPTLWAAPADALTTPIVFCLYEELVGARGIATARGAISVLSAALAWGRRRGKVSFRLNDGANPAHDLGMAAPPPRIRFATRAEVEALVATADALGRPELGDMVLLGVWTGQRQGDRLALEDHGLRHGRRAFRQAKTGARVEIREAPELAARLAAAAERRRPAKAAALLAARPEEREEIERRFRRVILNELVDGRHGVCFWRPFRTDNYRHTFAGLRGAAVAGVRAAAGGGWLVAPCPSLADFDEMDLRDTAVTWMALAGATIPQIIAVTGHTAQSANTILRHYLARHPEMADSAMAKMVAWYDAGGETETGL